MADLTWGDVVVIGAVATLGFTLLSFWFSGVMSRRGWSWQIHNKPRKRGAPPTPYPAARSEEAAKPTPDEGTPPDAEAATPGTPGASAAPPPANGRPTRPARPARPKA